MKLIKAALPTAVMLIASTSCTLDEPSYPAGAASQMRLSSVSSYGITLMKWEYDKQNRVTEINVGNDIIYQFSYIGDSKSPDVISGKSYDYEYDYDKDKEVRILDETWEWTGIKTDSDGHITYYDCTETIYRYNTTPETTTSQVSLEYDSNGQIILLADQSFDPFTMSTITDYVHFNWKNGLLVNRTDSGPNPEIVTIEYSDVENPNRQWDPNNEMFGPIATTGFFGVAPKKFAKSSTSYYNGNYDWPGHVIQYSYNLLPNGLIRMSKVKDDNDITVVMTYTYEKL